MKTESKAELLNRLFSENGLLREDWHEHKHYRIITRSGIEKIQYKNMVTVEYITEKLDPDFCVIRAIAKKDTLTIQTYGSASPKNCQSPYLPEMAEKRALSRAVLKICNFYELGVFGEDEAEDFKEEKTAPKASKKQDPSPAKKSPSELLAMLEGVKDQIAAAKSIADLKRIYQDNSDMYEIEDFNKAMSQRKIEIKNQEALEAALNDEPKPITINQKTQILLLLNHSVITREEKEKVIGELNTFDFIKAEKSIVRLKKVIQERQNAESSAN